jgi:hypothetical protein
MQWYQVYKVIILKRQFQTSVSVCLIMKFIYQFLLIVLEKVFNRRYWLFLTPMNYATRLRFVTQKQPHE